MSPLLNDYIFGVFLGLSLILVIGPQNIFVIEQGLKKQKIFLVCITCSIADCLLIFLGIFIFTNYKNFITPKIELILNVILVIFLINFIYQKIKYKIKIVKFKISKKRKNINIFFKTLGFTFLNPNVYSDTIFIIGNISKNLNNIEKLLFGLGATTSSFLFFFILGYSASFFSTKINNYIYLKFIDATIIVFIIFIIILVTFEIILNIKTYNFFN